ncbi:mitochondrial ATP synthase g subunit-domain-containing protein [Peziza echinospora]|nr:mitochondrial ATP synthase g subunit-domain-containing protein [Peziza echinospora]
MRPTTNILATLRRQITNTPFRSYSTAGNTTQNATTQVAAGAQKVGQTLQSLSTKAGPAALNALKTLGKVGGRTGALVKQIEAAIPPTLQALRVARELTKIVFHARQMAPPPISAFETQYKTLVQRLQNPSSLAKSFSVQNVLAKLSDTAALKNTGIIAAEVLGFFTVGEMIGRRKIVGYRGKVASAAHH